VFVNIGLRILDMIDILTCKLLLFQIKSDASVGELQVWKKTCLEIKGTFTKQPQDFQTQGLTIS